MNLSSMLEALSDPQQRHAAIVHLPIALSVLGLIPLFLSACFLGKKAALRWTAVGCYALLLGLALLATNSGMAAFDDIPTALAPDVDAVVHEHEEMAEKVWLFALGIAVLAAASGVGKRALRGTFAWASVALGVGTAGWVGATAHHGGTAVYVHGVGMPIIEAMPSASMKASSAGAPGDDPRAVFFVRQVLPILESNCMNCHNAERTKGGLNQTSIALLLEGGHSGEPAIVPGDPATSLLIRAAKHEVPDLEMPPPGRNDPLTAEQIAVLERWVRDGAVWGE